MNLAEFAGACKALAERAEADLAVTAARAGARELLAAMHVVTPVQFGTLRASEVIQSVSGGGSQAIAQVGPDGSVVYDEFRDKGGTITVKRAKVLGTPAVGFFGKSVTQAGSHYMERAEDEGRPMVEAAIKAAAEEFLTL